MELDDLKNTWDNQDHNPQHKAFTDKTINKMTQLKYNSKIKKIVYPEIIGTLICLAAAIFIVLNFYKLDSAILQGVGILSILILLTLSVISLLSLRKLKMTGDFTRPYAETLKTFATQKLEFYQFQKINITLSYLLLVTIIILLSKLFNGRDITDNKYFWMFSFSFGYLFLLVYSRFVTKFYKSTLRKTEELLQELQA